MENYNITHTSLSNSKGKNERLPQPLGSLLESLFLTSIGHQEKKHTIGAVFSVYVPSYKDPKFKKSHLREVSGVSCHEKNDGAVLFPNFQISDSKFSTPYEDSQKSLKIRKTDRKYIRHVRKVD